MREFPCIPFHQFGGSSHTDQLFVFAAPAKVLANWAGIPRKGWHVRMLFQRMITQRREKELEKFWNTASAASPGSEEYILGPTAITVGIQNDPIVNDGKIALEYAPVIDFHDSNEQNIKKLADLILPNVKARLTDEQNAILMEFETSPFNDFPDIEHDYVFEFSLQLAQMKCDSSQFVSRNEVSEEAQVELITAMEAICRPAIVIDGQHRLNGAARIERDVMLPVVAMPQCSWTDQVYQFVVINEKAQRVETSLLTDIFGSSLTQSEQMKLRQTLGRAKVNIEERIAAVVANRDPESPFFNMVQLQLEGPPPAGISPYITDRTIRLLIDGGSGRNATGWRIDDEFYERFVAHTYPDRSAWDNWNSGIWRKYWFVFWHTVGEFYNDQARQSNHALDLWSSAEQSNLTKAVTLRTLQSLFMQKCVERMDDVERTREILVETLGETEAGERIQTLIDARSIVRNTDDFGTFVEEFFLENGIPVRVFLAKWRKSLDDAQGQQDVWDELEKAWVNTKSKRRYRIGGPIFSTQGND